MVNKNPFNLYEKETLFDELSKYNFLDAAERSVKNESLTVQAFQLADNLISDDFQEDLAYTDSMRNETIKLNQTEIHPDFIHNLESVKSQDEMNYMVDYLKEETGKQRYLESLGFSGFLLNLGSNLVDVPLLLTGIGGVAKVAPSILSSGGLNGVRRALLGAGTELALEGAKDLIGQKDRTAVDYAMSAVFGAGVGAVFKNNELISLASSRTIKNTLKTDELEKKLAKATTEDEKIKIQTDHFDSLNLDQNVSYRDALENLQNPKVSKFNKNPIYDSLRADLAYRTAKSESETLKKFADDMYIDATNQANPSNKKSMVETATTIEDQIIDNYSLQFFKTVQDFGSIGFEKGFIANRFSDISTIASNIMGQAQQRRNLYAESSADNIAFIKDELRAASSVKRVDSEFEANLDKLATDMHKINSSIFTKAYDILSRAGKKDFIDNKIPKRDEYMPIVYNRNMSEILASKNLGYKDFVEFIKGSAVSQLDKKTLQQFTEEERLLVEEAAEFVAGKIWKNKHSDTVITKSFDDLFREALESQQGISKEAIDRIFPTTTKNIDKDLAASANARSPLDYSYKSPDGKLSFMDLVETDMTGIVAQYARKMGGTAALEQIKIKELVKDFDYETVKGIKDQLKTAIKNSKQQGTQLKTYIDSEFDRIIKDAGLDPATVAPLKKEILAATNDLIAFTKEIARSVYKSIDDETLKQDTEYVKQAMAKAFELNKDEVKELNKAIDTLFTKETTVEYALDSKENIAKARDLIFRELTAKQVGKRQIQNDLTRFDETIKEMQGLPTAVDPFSEAVQAQRILKNLNIARLLGQTGWTMTAELGSVAFEAGIKNFMEFSSFKQMFRQFKTGEITDELAQEIQLNTGLGATLTRAIGVNKYDHDFKLSDISTVSRREGMLNKIETFSEKATEATLLAGGVKPLTAGFEMIMAKSILHQIIQVSKKAKLTTGDLNFLNEIGIDDVMAKKIMGQIEKHGTFEAKTWSNGHKVKTLNFDNWDDIDAQDMLINSLRRKAHQVVQRSNLGDKLGTTIGGSALDKNTIGGRLFLELKDYMITSYTKQLGRGLERKDAYVAGLWATQLAMLSLGTAMQNYTNFAGNQEKFDKSMKFENFARTVIGRMPPAAYIPTVMDNAARFATGDTIFSSNRYHSGVQDAFMSMPTVDLLGKASTLISVPFRSTFGDGLKDSDISAIFGVAPLGNTYGVRTVQEYLKDINE